MLGAVASFLRVYEPLEAFPADERAWWRALAAAGPQPASAMAAREHAAALRALTALPPRVVSDHDLTDGAARPVGIVLSPDAPDGRLRVCPTELTWRALLALEEFQTDIAPTVLPAFIPAGVVDAASGELARLVSERSSLTGPHMRSCRWSVPLPWFAAFQPSHREADPPSPSSRMRRRTDVAPQSEGAPIDRPDADQPALGRQPARRGVSGSRTPLYRAPMADARRCLARALASARVAETSLLPLADLEELGRWLEEFHARSVIELDAAGLGAIVGEGVVVDESVAAVSLGLGELRAGKVDAAVERLAVVRDRWDEIRAHEHAS